VSIHRRDTDRVVSASRFVAGAMETADAGATNPPCTCPCPCLTPSSVRREDSTAGAGESETRGTRSGRASPSRDLSRWNMEVLDGGDRG
jgi:hypothetical protein